MVERQTPVEVHSLLEAVICYHTLWQLYTVLISRGAIDTLDPRSLANRQANNTAGLTDRHTPDGVHGPSR